MTGRKRYLNGNEEIRKTFKKLTASFDNFINHSLLILFYFLFSIPSFSFSKLFNPMSPRHLFSSVEWGLFCYRFTRDCTFRSLVPTIFLTSSCVHLHIFCNCTLEIKLTHTPTSTVNMQTILENLIQQPGD